MACLLALAYCCVHRKFNNNDFIPGQQAVQNTPNMLSLFSYFSTQKQLLMCDIQVPLRVES